MKSNFDLLSERACKSNIDAAKKAFWRTQIISDMRRQPCYLCMAYDYCMSQKGKKCDDVIRDFLSEKAIEMEVKNVG